MFTVNLNEFTKREDGKRKPHKETLWEVSYLECTGKRRSMRSLLFVAREDAEIVFNDTKSRIESDTELHKVIKQEEKKNSIDESLVRKTVVYSLSDEHMHTIGVTLKRAMVY